MNLVHWFLEIISIFTLVISQVQNTVLQIPDGKINGSVRQTIRQNKTYSAFQGIPFAKPPLGRLRFAVPEKNDPWSGILDTTQDKGPCTQASSIIGSSSVIGTEDCLYINVYTTNITGGYPVMVWIYGGGFLTGSSAYAANPPDYLIEEKIIFVSFNYRLGSFGFLSTEDQVAPGNWGLKDQVLALKWVKKNIQYFGGNPNKVTVFGQSAGAASIAYLIQNERASGLFHAAILESASSLSSWALTLPRNATAIAFSVGHKLGINTSDSNVLINELRKVDYRQLKLADNNLTMEIFEAENIFRGFSFGVVREPPNPNAVFTKKSHRELSNGKFNKIPVIIGYNSNEGGNLQPFPDLLRNIFEQPDFDVSFLAPIGLTNSSTKRKQAGKAIKNYFFGSGDPALASNDSIIRFFSQEAFYRPIRETVRLMANYVNVFFYIFSYEGYFRINSTYTGVGHGEELFYLFAFDLNNNQDEMFRLKIVSLWTDFVKTSNPTPNAIKNVNLYNGVTWIPNTLNTNASETIKYLNINKTFSMESNPFQKDWKIYQKIYSEFGDPPYTTY